MDSTLEKENFEQYRTLIYPIIFIMKVSDISNCCDLIWWEWDAWRRYLDLQTAIHETTPKRLRDHTGGPFRRPSWTRLHYWLFLSVLSKSWNEVMTEPFPAWLRVKNSCGICHELGGHCRISPSRYPHDCRVSLGNILCAHQEDAHLLTTVERLMFIGKANGWVDPHVADKMLAQTFVYVDTSNRMDGIAVGANNFLWIHRDERWSFFRDIQRESPYIFSPQIINLINTTWLKLRNFETKDEFRAMIRPLQNAFGELVSQCLDNAKPICEEMGEKEINRPLLWAKDICAHFDTDNLWKVVRQLYYDPASIPLN